MLIHLPGMVGSQVFAKGMHFKANTMILIGNIVVTRKKTVQVILRNKESRGTWSSQLVYVLESWNVDDQLTKFQVKN